MLPTIAGDAAKRALFLREVETMLHLQHPNLLSAFEVGEAGPGFFISMPFCEWGSISSYQLQYGGKLPSNVAVEMLRQFLSGLAFAHARGFVHRDLKPDNVLVSSEGNGTIKIADFGLAKSFEKAGLSGMTVTGSAAGTPLFMPREQLVNFKRVKPASDVWSAAATFYHMVTGAFPRELEDGVDPIAWVLRAPIVPLAQRAPELPPAIVALVDRALDPDPERRPADAGAFLRALEDTL
jgi:serine/threonine protein kinase